MHSVSLYPVSNHRRAPGRQCLVLPTEKTSTSTVKCSQGELTQGAGHAKTPNLPCWEQPWEMFHVVDAMVGGLKGTQGLPMRGSTVNRGRGGSRGNGSSNAQRRRSKWTSWPALSRKWGHDPGKVLDHHHPALDK